ncbi:class I SAM-dependent methyltransferase [Streptomyces sp. NPDC050704]|uniref:class I SAM-dependent methyltransferase n=1 Tax=Streptomyces sp. NPDC050704 TaxID=3157219 RepID=UPI0034429A9F
MTEQTSHVMPGLAGLLEGPHVPVPGAALDLGCGKGDTAVYLAQRGWEVTGVDLDAEGLAHARSGVAAAGARVRLVEGDVTRLDALDVGDGYALLVDSGCYHTLADDRRDAYVDSVNAVAAEGATLFMLAITRVRPGRGADPDEVRARFKGWRLVDCQEMPREDVLPYLSGTRRMSPHFDERRRATWARMVRIGIASGRIKLRRYLLVRTP